MEKVIFDGKILKLTTEQIGDKLIERVYLPSSAHTFLITDEGKIRLTVEYKIGKGDIKEKLQAGIVEAGDSALETAKRELMEELGLEAESWQEFVTFTADETINNVRVYFIARGLKQVTIETDGEILHTKDYSLEELYQKAMQGTFSSPTQAAIARMWYLVQKGELEL